MPMDGGVHRIRSEHLAAIVSHPDYEAGKNKGIEFLKTKSLD